MRVMIERNGESREIAGWRRWAIGIPIIALLALMMALAILLVLGVAATIGVVVLVALIIGVPILLILALMGRVVVTRD
jgi:hypothetical protein